jgi:hypothetical protein
MTKNLSLTGRWHGRYTYLDGGEGESFVADLVEALDAVTGSTTETANFHDGYTGVRLGSISGSRNGALVSFVKFYKFGHGHDLPIKYQGEVNDDATEIEGTWLIDRQGFGRFLLIRSIALPEPAAQLAYETA